VKNQIDEGAGAPPLSRELRSLARALAALKHALGRRYLEWYLKAPSLRASTAITAMALEERGQAGVLEKLAAAAGDDLDLVAVPFLLTHEATTWPRLVALAMIFDSSASMVLRALSQSAQPLLSRWVVKFLQEERFHEQAAQGWEAELRTSAALSQHLDESVQVCLPEAGQWLEAILTLEGLWTSEEAAFLRMSWREAMSRTDIGRRPQEVHGGGG
jgi:1,2-phenylacetyl-CoA epoxidase catalytic subunit